MLSKCQSDVSQNSETWCVVPDGTEYYGLEKWKSCEKWACSAQGSHKGISRDTSIVKNDLNRAVGVPPCSLPYRSCNHNRIEAPSDILLRCTSLRTNIAKFNTAKLAQVKEQNEFVLLIN